MSKSRGQLNHSIDKEKAMERKIILLEERLRLVEQFVELRFCESFKDFTIRKILRDLPPEDEDSNHSASSEDDSHIPSNSKSRPPTSSSSSTQRSTRTSRRTATPSAPSSSKTTGATTTPTNKRELRVRVLRESQTTKVNQDSTSSSPPQPTQSLPLIKNPPPDDDSADDFEAMNYDHDPSDDFTDFNPEVIQDNPEEYSDFEGSSPSPPPSKRRAGPLSSSSSKNKRRRSSVKRIPPGDKKECPECHSFWKVESFEKHLQTHSKVRNLKCRFCDKKFIERKHVVEHERSHDLAKYGKMCRVEGCGQLCLDRSKQLVHERRCIKKKLGRGGVVDEEVLEDVRRRSQNVELGWPEEEEKEGEEEMGEIENNEEEIVEGVVELVEEGTEFVNNVEGDPLEGNFDNF